MKKRNTNNKQFNSDEHIKSMFQDFKAPYDPVSWDELLQKMDNATPYVPLNDKEIQSDLSNLTMPYHPDSWNALEERLDLLDTRKKWVLRGKLVELAMFFFVFYLFTASINQNTTPIEKNNEKTALNPISDLRPETTEIKGNNHIETETSVVSFNQHAGSSGNLKTSNILASGKKQTSISGKPESKTAIPLIFSEEAKPAISDLNKTINAATIQDSESLNEWSLQDHGSATDWAPFSNRIIEDEAEAPLEKLPLVILQVETENTDQHHLILPVLHPENFNKKKISFLIGTVIGYDKDLIKSPFPHQKSEVMLGRIEDNFRMGLNLAMDMNALEISAGVHYLIKNYKSVYAGENQVRIAHIPVMLKLKLPFAGFMRGYVAGGVSGNYVVHANYQEHDYFRDRPQLEYVQNNARAAGYSLLSSANYRNGIFEGETIRGNHFYTANIAIGLEAHINKIYSLFFEQGYSHHIKGSAIGPAFDHFFSSTSLLGIRYRIQHKHNQLSSSKNRSTLR